MRFDTFYIFALTLFIAAIGALIFQYIGTPLPWMLGPIASLIITSRLKSIRLAPPKILSIPARAVLGTIIGSAFTPQILSYLGGYVFSLAFIIPFVVLITLSGYWYYHKILGFDTPTAYFSSVPGGLLEMVTLAESYNANLYKVVLSQSSRLFFIAFSLPFIVSHSFHYNLDGRAKITQPLMQTDLKDLLLVACIAFLGYAIAKKLRISGAGIIGPMILSALAFGSGLVHTRPPTEIINAIQLILGSTVGTVFVGVKTKEMLKVLFQTFGFFIIITFICAFFVSIVYFSTDFNLVSIMLAFSPGGQAEMNIIAIVIAANLPYVALHHLVRMFLVMSIAPFLMRFLR